MTTIETGTDAMLAAHALCGHLIEEMPDDVVFTSWEIAENFVGGQYSTETSLNGAKRALVMLAHEFDLVYSEESRATHVLVNATGEIDGVQVQLWAHVGRPRVDQVAQTGGDA